MKDHFLAHLLLYLLIAITPCVSYCQSATYKVIDPKDYDHPVRVACIGASTTYGANIYNPPLNSFPSQLGCILGSAWEVRNFGVNSTGVLRKGEFPYWNTKAFLVARDFLPDIVILNLGVNDTKAQNWRYKQDFEKDCMELIKSFQSLSSHPKVYLCREVPVFVDRWGIRSEIVKKELWVKKRLLASKMHLPVIDLYTPLLSHPNLFKDGVHPDAAGANIMAIATAKALTGGAKILPNMNNNMHSVNKRTYPDMYPGRLSKWKGFDRYDFQFDLLNARLVIPKQSTTGRPWVWRARFPDWHTDMDSILLSHGFTIFYLNTDSMLGSVEAIEHWNKLYHYLTEIYHLDSKVALEGVSRGGLYIYRFAKTYPQRVSCIYAEAPVCDIKSWPGGKGRSPGDSAEWTHVLKQYHLSETQALAYKDNPIDSLEKMAKYKIPIWHSIGLQDSLAPPAENTFILAKRYLELGGPITIYPNTLGPVSLHGHHFPIDDPGAGANFIEYNAFKK